MTKRPITWDEIYSTRAASELSWYQHSAATSLALLDRLAIDSSASVIDVGAGASSFVDGLLERGHHDVTLVDLSEVGLEQARARLGERGNTPQWLVADLLRWRPQRHFDVWHDRAVFHFLTTSAERRHYLTTLRAATAPGGTVLVAAFAADGPTTCSGRPTSCYSADELAAEFGPDFTVLHTEREEHHTPRGAVQPFTWVAFSRN